MRLPHMQSRMVQGLIILYCGTFHNKPNAQAEIPPPHRRLYLFSNYKTTVFKITIRRLPAQY